MAYTITKHTAPIEQTHWWKDQNRSVPADVYWIEGHGISRLATETEVDLWLQGPGGCQILLACKKPVGHEGQCNTSCS